MDSSFGQVVDSSENLLILLPGRPFLDQVASGLSLFLSLRDKKEVQISCPAPMTVEFNRLVGVNKISSDLGSKNLTLRFPDYPADNIERVSYDIEDGQFRLTVIPKPSAPSPKKEQIRLSYTGVSADTVILVGGVNETHFPALLGSDLAGVKLVHIGKRGLSLPKEKEVMSFARPASSVSEVVTELIKEANLVLDADIATNLLAGIEAESSGLSSSEVNADTFEVVAELLRAGGRRYVREKQEKFVAGSIPGKTPVEEVVEETPKGWVGPKIYKGNTIS